MKIRLFVVGLGCLAAAGARADILFDNFGPGDDFQYHNGLLISDAQTVAVPFTVPGTYRLTAVTVGLGFSPGALYRVSLSHRNEPMPGLDIYFWDFHSITTDGAVRLGPLGAVDLTPGDYYIVVQKDGGLDGVWGYNSLGQTGTYASTNITTSEWQYSQGLMPALRVEAVPEPASLLALGGLVVATLKRRRKV